MATINDIQTQILTPIANAIRTKEGTTAKIPNSQLASRIENLQTGTKVEGTIDITENGTYDVSQYASANVSVASSGGGEDMLQQMINATNSCDYLFYYYKGSSVDFISNLNTSKVISMASMFEDSAVQSVVLGNTSNVENMSFCFRNCVQVKTILLKDTSRVKKMQYMFFNCAKLTSVTEVDMSNVLYTTSMFDYDYELVDLTLLNIKLAVGFHHCSKLTLDSLVNICKELINVGSARTLTMGSTNLSKIASTYVKFTDSTQTEIAVDTKGDVVVCESTDEGAMLLSDYALLKNWTLA